jgi:hypothetical protein
MFCSQCGAGVAEGVAFCSSCGAKLLTSLKEKASTEAIEYEDFVIDIPDGRKYWLADTYGVHPDQREAARQTRMWEDHNDIVIARINERGKDGWQLAGSEPLGPRLLTVVRGQHKSSAWGVYGLGLLFFLILAGIGFSANSWQLGSFGALGFWIWAFIGFFVAASVNGRERRWDQVTGCRVTLRRTSRGSVKTSL